MKLCNIKPLGRYKNTITNQEYNVKTGYRKDRGTDHKFYLYRGARVYISDSDFYNRHEKLNQ